MAARKSLKRYKGGPGTNRWCIVRINDEPPEHWGCSPRGAYDAIRGAVRDSLGPEDVVWYAWVTATEMEEACQLRPLRWTQYERRRDRLQKTFSG